MFDFSGPTLTLASTQQRQRRPNNSQQPVMRRPSSGVPVRSAPTLPYSPTQQQAYSPSRQNSFPRHSQDQNGFDSQIMVRQQSQELASAAVAALASAGIMRDSDGTARKQLLTSPVSRPPPPPCTRPPVNQPILPVGIRPGVPSE